MKTKHSSRLHIEMTIIGGLCAALLNMPPAAAAPIEMTVDHLLNICEASNVQAARERGDELGWQRLTDAETEEWRTHFTGYNGGTVEIIGWRRDKSGRADSLSFWATKGLNGHKMCSYSTRKVGGLLDDLSEQLGAPDNLDKNDTIENITAWWLRETVEYSFVKVGSSAIVTIGPRR